MVQPDADTANDKCLFKNALTGKLTLENKLKELAFLQSCNSLATEETPVLKYYNNSSVIAGTYSPLPDAYTSLQQSSNFVPRQIADPSSARFYKNGFQSRSQRRYVPKFYKKNNFKIPASLIETSQSFTTGNLHSKSERFAESFENRTLYNENDLIVNTLEQNSNFRTALPCHKNINRVAINVFNKTHKSLTNLDPNENIFPMPTPNVPLKNPTSRLTKVGVINKSAMSAGESTLSKPVPFNQPPHYNSTVSKSMNYKPWSTTLNQATSLSRPTSSNRQTDTTSSATNTLNSYLQRLSDEHLKAYEKASHNLASQTNGCNDADFKHSDKNVQYTLATIDYDRANLSSRNDMRNNVAPAMNDLLRDIAITNSQPRTKTLVSTSGVLLPHNNISTLSKNRLVLAAHRNHSMAGNNSRLTSNTSSNSNHASIQCQSSRLITDESLTVQNSSHISESRILLKSAGRTRRSRSAKQKEQRTAQVREASPFYFPRQLSSVQQNRVNSAKFDDKTSARSKPRLNSATNSNKSSLNKTVIMRNSISNNRKNDVLSNGDLSEVRTPPITARTSKRNSLNECRMSSIGNGETSTSTLNEIDTKLLQEESMQLDAIISKQFKSDCNVQRSGRNYFNGGSASEVTATEYDVESEQDEIEYDETTDEYIEDTCEAGDGASMCSDKAMDEFYLDDDDIDCVDPSAIDCLDDDDVGSEDANSEYSISTSDSQTGIDNASTDAENIKPALNFGNFSNCPPVINFGTKSEKVEQLPADIRKLLKWKMSPITPIVVRHTIARSGFKPSKKSYDWIGYFGKHMKSSGFRSLREYQKINHFPGSFQLGRKDRLWRNLSRMQTRFGKKEFGFIPQSYILPWDKKLLKTAWEEGSSKQKFIIKPPASARGIGIRVIHKWSQVPTKKPILVQRYISRPYLINNRKFDLRLYVYVTSFDPLRIYLFNDGLVRFATCKYTSSMKHLSNRYMHLTNYSVNKKSSEFEQNDDASVCQGHKWSIKALWRYLQEEKEVDTDKIWKQMKDICIKTIISVEQFTNSLVKSNCRRPSCCHELFGFDIMLDERLKPWMLEVNISPSLHSNSPLDAEIKGIMVKDMFNLAGFQIPDKKVVTAASQQGNNTSMSAALSFSQEKRKQSHETTADSRSKHTYFAQHYKQMDEAELTSLMLDILTVNDIRVLVENDQEFSRKGNFERIFPGGHETKKYMNYFEQPRYYNVLEHVWENKYANQRHKGTALLESFCRRGLHKRQSPNSPPIPPEHVWSPSQHIKLFTSPRTDARLLTTTIKHSQQQHHPHASPSSASTLSMYTHSNGLTPLPGRKFSLE